MSAMDTSAPYVLFYDFQAGALFVSLMSCVVSARAFICLYMYAIVMNVDALLFA